MNAPLRESHTMSKTILESLRELAEGLVESGAMSEATFREFNALCQAEYRDAILVGVTPLSENEVRELVASTIPSRGGYPQFERERVEERGAEISIHQEETNACVQASIR